MDSRGQADPDPRSALTSPIPLEAIRAAAARAGPHVRRTPLVPLDDGRFLKLESLQPTGSFKVRGFFAAALSLSAADRERGLSTVSAGNAAMACAYVARALDLRCRVFMVETAPAPKVAGVRRWGATPIFMSRERLNEWIVSRGWEAEPESFIHPFADEAVIAGHGGIGLELVEDVPALTRIVVPVGGGGLVSGIASAVKALRPNVEIVGAQSDGYALWSRALEAGGPVSVVPETIADGTTAPFTAAMFARVRALVDRWVVVPESRLRVAVAELARGVKLVAEGAGALAYAALEQLPYDGTTVAIVSGGNVDPALLSDLLRSSA